MSWKATSDFVGPCRMVCGSKGKPYSTLALNLLLYGCEKWVLTAPLRQQLHTSHNRCVRAMALPHRTVTARIQRN
jgi:hypothetical protein